MIIAGAGGAAHLPGMVASMTTLPVLGVPVESRALKGLDSLLSIAQMPGGVPVATFAIGEAGAKNAALQAAAILALSDAALDKRLDAWRAKQTRSVAKTPEMSEIKRLNKPVPPGGMIGIIGGGQLGRMLAMAAARLGLKAAIYNDGHDAPAFQVTPLQLAARYDDRNMLTGFAEICDAITFEFENLPADSIAYLAEPEAASSWPARAGDHPGPAHRKKLCALAGPQDRALFCGGFGAKMRAKAFAEIGGPAILKTRRLGYDGKGQAKVTSADETARAFDSFKGCAGHPGRLCRFRVRGLGGGGAFAGWQISPPTIRPRISMRIISFAARLCRDG